MDYSTHSSSRVSLLFVCCILLSGVICHGAPLRIVAPNGGERFRVGSAATIRWEGVAATDTVTLEYSTDSGTNWNLITNAATGLQYVWSPVPNTPSDFCLMRISTNAVIGDSVLYLKSLRSGFSLPDAVHYAEFSPDGSRVIGGGATGEVFIWDSFTGALLMTIPVESGTFPSQPGITRISEARYTPDGKLFATLSPLDARTGSTVRIFDAATGAKLREWTQDEGANSSSSGTCVFSPDGSKLLVMGLDGGTIYNVADGSVVLKLTGYSGTDPMGNSSISSMVDGDWSRDGTSIIGAAFAVPGLIPDFILSDPLTGNVVHPYLVPSTGVTSSVRFNPDASRFISTSTDGTARVFDVATGAEVFNITDYQRYPNWAEFSHDGKQFATAGQDNGSPNWRLRLYDAATGAPIRIVGAIINGMRNLAFSPDDSRILVSCIDGVRIFHAPSATAGQFDISDSLWSIYVTSGAAITIAAPTVTARQGEHVLVPIVIDNPAAALGAGATRVNVTLRYNVSLLAPEGTTPVGTFDATARTIDLSFPIASATDTVLGTLTFRAALGTDSTTVLDLSGAAADIPTVSVAERDGLFRLSDLCREGGARLLNPNGTVALKIIAPGGIPTEMDAEIETIEDGRTTLALVDINGHEARRWLDGAAPPGRWRMPLDLDGVASGPYFVVLRTPTVVKIVPLEVVR